MSASWRPLAAALVLTLWTPASIGSPDGLRVEVQGLEGSLSQALGRDTLKKNVRSVLSIDDARKEKDLDERRIRALHELAPDEIRRALRPFGFYKPVIDASLEKDGDTWVATYRVEPGPEMRVSTADVTISGEGAQDPRFQSQLGDFPIGEGDVLVSPDYEAGKKKLEDLASRIGYVNAGFTEHRVEVDLDTYAASLRLHFDTGPLYVFGPATFEQGFLDPRVLRGYVTWKEGAPLDLDELLRMQGALSDSPYFSRVEVESKVEEAGPDHRVPILVSLLPSKPIKLHFGVGYGTDTGPRGTASMELRRLNRRGHRVLTELTLSRIEQSFAARYLIPGYYPRTDVLAFSLGYARFRPGTSKSNTALAGVERTQSRGRWRETLGLLLQREQFTVGVDKGTSTLLMPSAQWERVKADDRLFTRHGWKLVFDLKAAARNVVSDVTFVRPTVLWKLVRTIARDTRLLGRAEVGYIVTSDFRRLPPRIRFFAGGDQSVRGYRFQRLGERDEEGNVIGGEALRTVSLEVDHMVTDWLGGLGLAVFADAGNATRSFSGDLVTGAGAGVRWRSPIGMVRADVAFALDLPQTPLRLHLNIGPDL